jgi:hypothetical protein
LRTFELSVAINVPPRVGVSAVRLLASATEHINTPADSTLSVFFISFILFFEVNFSLLKCRLEMI